MSNMVLYYIIFIIKNYNNDSPDSPPNFLTILKVGNQTRYINVESNMIQSF